MKSQTEISDKWDLPDKGRNLLKEFAIVNLIGFVMAVIFWVALVNADSIDRFFIGVYKWLAL